MGQIEETIHMFDHQIMNANEQIARITKGIYDTDKSIRSRIMKFQDEINGLHLEGQNLFEKELSDVLEQYKSGCTKWCETVNSLIEGKEFINQFEKSVLVVVFGNVNVGKSSVGNLIAGVSDPDSNKARDEKDDELLQKFFGEPPVFYEYDMAGGNAQRGPRRKRHSFFKEGYVETTANIQYFTRKEGLTWTDSPGIASVNKANGELAKKYVEFADLVIFITTSSSPGKQDELQELKKLFGKKKPVLILINKSDYYEEDEVDGEIVKFLLPKSQENRKKQEIYVQESFQDEAFDIVSQIDAVSVSTYLALEAIRKDDAALFEQSGFPRFYGKLGKLFEQNAVELKMNAPRQRINAVIDVVLSGEDAIGAFRNQPDEAAANVSGGQSIEGISQFLRRLEIMKDEAQNAKDRISTVSEKAVPQICNLCMAEITPLVQGQAHQVRKGGQGGDLSQQINQIVTQKTAEVLEKEFKEVLEDYGSGMIKQQLYRGIQNVHVDAKKENVERIIYEVKTVKRNPEGILEHVEHFLFKTEFTRDQVRKRRITESFINGDNSTEVLRQIQKNINGTIKGYVQAFAHNVKSQYFGQEEAIIDKITEMLLQLKKDLEGEKTEDGRQHNSGL